MVNILPVRRAVRVIMRGIKSINYGAAREHFKTHSDRNGGTST